MRTLRPWIWGGILLAVIGCAPPGKYDYLITGDKTRREELTQLLADVSETNTSPESRFILNQQIIRLVHTPQGDANLNLYLTQYTADFPDDPFNGYYLLLVAQGYKKSKADPMAIEYYKRVLENYNDLIVENQSIHYNALKNLIMMTENPEDRVNYYKELISRFGDDVDLGPTYYYLGKSYEAIGEWDLSVQAYKNFLRFPGTQIPGVPLAYKKIQEQIAFYDYRRKNWTYADLDVLVSRIKYALATRNNRTLSRYRSKVNFFAVSWAQSPIMASDEFLSGLGGFMKSRIRYGRTLTPDSNSQEAYLKTWGWTYRVPTWYLYFRRVNLPSNPEIHNQWEWAGIYFGNKPFVDQ